MKLAPYCLTVLVGLTACNSKDKNQDKQRILTPKVRSEQAPTPVAPTPVAPTPVAPTPVASTPVAPTPPSAVWDASNPEYWIYEVENNNLIFNTPWDAQEGDGIVNDLNSLPADGLKGAAEACLKKLQDELTVTLTTDSGQTLWQELKDLKATPKVTIMLNILPRADLARQLTIMDRAPALWHWNQIKRQDFPPQIAFSDYKKGSFYFEGAVTPSACYTPKAKNSLEFLSYVKTRLKKARS